MTTLAKKRPAHRNRHQQDSEALVLECKRLSETKVDFIPNPEFGKVTKAEHDVLLSEAQDSQRFAKTAPPKDLPAHLARMCEANLLSPRDERDLFYQLNYFKFRANALRARLDPGKPDAKAIQQIRTLLDVAKRVRDQIIQANMRLAISVVKKFVTPRHSFDDLLSEGMFSLMQAVDKFDFDRGFRFSTYAYRAIARNAYRTITDGHKDSSRFATGANESVFEAPDESNGNSIREGAWDKLRHQMGDMLHQLDRRERFIIRSRYALGSHREVRTFQALADKLGVSKERVRQLEQRAVSKLRTMAAEMEMHDLADVAFA